MIYSVKNENPLNGMPFTHCISLGIFHLEQLNPMGYRNIELYLPISLLSSPGMVTIFSAVAAGERKLCRDEKEKERNRRLPKETSQPQY